MVDMITGMIVVTGSIIATKALSLWWEKRQEKKRANY